MSTHRSIIIQGTDVWNKWRQENPGTKPDLRGADLGEAWLMKADLREADLRGANFYEANLIGADMGGADLGGACFILASLNEAVLREAKLVGTELTEADLIQADLTRANLEGADLARAQINHGKLVEANLRGTNLEQALLLDADLTGADLSKAKLIEADLRAANLTNAKIAEADLFEADLRISCFRGADLSGANLTGANLVGADLRDACLTNCRVYAVSAWNLQTQNSKQSNLIITSEEEPDITVDDLEVAQFIYLLLNNEKIRKVIITITSKVVLILGRFSPERKVILEAIREALRRSNYLPVMFDFEKPSSRNLVETVSTLAHMACFVIADITDPRSVPQELQAIVPHLPSVPVQPLLQASEEPYGIFESFKSYPWVLETYRYGNLDELLASIQKKVIAPAEAKAKELRKSQS